MWLRFLTQWKISFSLLFSFKVGTILCLFVLSILVVACSPNTSSATNVDNPPVTVTIDLNKSNSSPTPTLPEYSCGAWATQSSPPFGTSTVGVYAKFVHNVKTDPNDPNDVGNPQGVDGASAVATVIWPDGTQAQVSGTTGADGLVSFPISTANRSDAINKLTLVTVQFTKDGIPPCTVDQTRAAFFTLVTGTSSGSTPISGTGNPKPGPTGTPGGTQKPGPTGTPVKGH